MTIAVIARMREDGALELRGEDRERLGLKAGEEVELKVEVPASSDEDESANPLYGIIGLGRSGRRDGAKNHDRIVENTGSTGWNVASGHDKILHRANLL